MVSRVGKCLLGKYLWVTNTLSSGVLLSFGDSIQQWLEKVSNEGKERPYDWKRTGLSQGPPHHIWYTRLDRVFPKKNLSSVSYKILADQIFAAPFFAFTFFLGMGIMEGKNIRAAIDEFKRKFISLYLFDWCFWPPVQFINFVWIPTTYRVIYVNAATVVWDVFLSYIKHYDQYG
ncbi:mpv17-like protein 2 isoform X2 [Hetaerina americana]|uniref:mpv17-like protein 2 isoform X2 n=1 Tax=Hetaerina americana TaxID=62018 RepID=UPI003A7F5ABA